MSRLQSVPNYMCTSQMESDRKRRKVRKGTSSCWQCKRRKVRCIFGDDSATICQNCKRRRTTCTSQEYDEATMSAVDSVEVRLSRVERALETILGSTDLPMPRTFDDLVGSVDDETSRLSQNISGGLINHTAVQQPRYGALLSVSATQKSITSALIATWPGQHEIETIDNVSIDSVSHVHGRFATPYSAFMDQRPPSARDALDTPTSGLHPVLAARKLLMLGIFIQSIALESRQQLINLGIPVLEIMSRVVETAVRLVATDEDLIRCVEGLECILIEAMYHNYAGDLHRAWMAIRRVVSVAEVMGLQRHPVAASLRILDPNTRDGFDPEQLCFRIVEMDRYLSLMLGLPRSSLESSLATLTALEGCQPVDYVRRCHCIVADLILGRSERHLLQARDADALLQKAANQLPPQWWLAPELSFDSTDSSELLSDVFRLMIQFAHYHLLVRLHLPYIKSSSFSPSSDYSNITASSASREILKRYNGFRLSNQANYYCRGTDYVALSAATVLCLVYIQSHTLASESTPSSDPLAHSRPGDRALLEQTLGIIDSMARTGNDATSMRIGQILSRLLFIEAEAASGQVYHTNASQEDHQGSDYHGGSTNDTNGMYIHIPHFGTITFNCDSWTVSGPHVSGPDVHFNARSAINKQAESHPDHSTGATEYTIDTDTYAPVPTANVDTTAWEDWDLHGIDVALFNSLFSDRTVFETRDIPEAS